MVCSCRCRQAITDPGLELPPAPKRKRLNPRIPSPDAEDSAIEDPASDSATDTNEEAATNPARQRHRQRESPSGEWDPAARFIS